MIHIRHILALAGAMAIFGMSSPAAAQCNCAAASLVGDTVTTQAGNGPILSAVVSAAVEHPGAGPGLGMAGPPPRMNINYGASTIRVDFIQQPATYGPNYVFHFASLNPIPPQGCTGQPQIVGISVQTNKPGAAFIAAGATFGPNSVNVPFTSSANLDWLPGEFILVNLTYACAASPTTGTFDPCCPPWNSTQLKSMLTYQGTTIGAPYTLHFTPTPQLHTQMNAYITYLQSLGMGFSMISLKFELLPGGTGATWAGSTASQTNVITWTGSGSPTPNFFSPGAMLPNTWYRIRTTVLLPPGGPFLPANCLQSYVDVRLQLIPSPAMKSGTPPAPSARLQMRAENGNVDEQPLTAAGGARD